MNNSTFNARRVPTFTTAQPYKAQALPSTQQSAKWEVVRTDYAEPEPIKSGFANNTYSKPIPLTESRARRLTIKMSDEEYNWLTNLYDLVGFKFESLDDMIRQFILQPEMRYKFLEYLSFSGNNEAIDHCINNQPSGFGWK